MSEPLEQVSRLFNNALRRVKALTKPFSTFFVETMLLVLTIPRRINFLQLARYGKSCESRFRQNFKKAFDWISFNLGFFEKQQGHLYAIAIDLCFISKSGKHTPGLGYFWSGCANAIKRGLEVLGIALIDATTREAIALRAVQTIVGKAHRGRPPKCIEHIEKNSLITHYLLALYQLREQLLALTCLLVADAYFAKQTFVDGAISLGFNVISRFRDDVRLRYLYNGEQRKGKGRKNTYDGLIDIHKPCLNYFTSLLLDWNGKQVQAYCAVVNVVSWERNVKVVIVDCLDDDKKTQTRKVFF